MSNKCGKCSVEIDSGEVAAKCIECKILFHPACTKHGSTQSFTKAKNKSWRCDICKTETISNRSNDDSEDKRTILEALNAMKNELRSSIDSLTQEFKNMNSRFSVLEENQQQLKERCDMLEQDRNELGNQVRELRLRLHDAEQHSRCSNVEIVGLPQTAGEDIYAVLESVARAICITFTRDDISIAHRLRLFSRKHSHPPVIVQFISRNVREHWLSAARRKRGLNAAQVSSSLPSSPLFINEHLTSINKELLGRARRLQRQKRIHFAGFFNGKVLVKAKEGDAATRVFTVEDLDKFEC